MKKARGRLTIIDALRDPRLFGALPAFRDLSTWRPWLIFLRATYGLPLSKPERAIFEKHTGRAYSPPAGGWPEVVCIVGRQSGKSRVASLIASYEAATAKPQEDRTDLYALLVSQDARAALRTLLSYARAPFELIPLLQDTVEGQTGDSVRLKNHVVLAAYPCRPQSTRGLRAAVAVCDELAFFRSTENLPTDTEMLRAIRPALATTGGKLIILSSPYGQSGGLWELHRQHFGREDSSTLIWQASAPDMNPTLPANYLERMAQDDPEAYRSEVLGEFRTGLSTFLDPDAIAACVAADVRERQPKPGIRYVAFCDPSGGRRDKFTLGIAHREGTLAILDAVRAWKPPFNPSGVVAEACTFLKTYGVYAVSGDRFSAEFVAEQFRTNGIQYTASERDRSTIYLEIMPLLNSERAVLLDHPELLKELRGLERRRGTSGKDRVDHRPGQHDDLANSAAGVLVLAGSGPAPMTMEQLDGFLAANAGLRSEPGEGDWRSAFALPG